jgi:signal transduction histidine kinase
VKHFGHDPKNSDSPANDNIASLVPDKVGGLWIGVHGKGLYFDGHHFTHFPPNPGDPAGLPGAYVLPLLLDARGILWIGTTQWGLVRLDTDTRKFTTYLIDPNHPSNQAVNWTEDAYRDGDSIWVASPTSGLFRFDPDAGKFTRRYTQKDGLASDTVLGIIGDRQGYLWVSTPNGLSRFDPKAEVFRNYDVFDGLQGGWLTHCRVQAPDGRLFFGGNNGISAFYPDKLADNRNPPRVVLTEFELSNKPVQLGTQNSPLRQAINVASSITLRHDQSVFSFQFAALDYTSPQKNGYAYKLDDFDRDWQRTDATRRFATYTNLDPGRYTFRVKASNNDGVWNEQGVALQLTIVPAWYQTSWFRAACVALFLAMIWGIYALRVRQLAAQFNMRLEERVAERTRVARDLHDTLLQSFQALLPNLQAGINMLAARPADARKVLEDTADHASQAIAEGRDAVQGLRMSTVEKNDLAVAIRTVGEELASAASTQPSPNFNVVVEGAYRNLHPILRDELYRLAVEALRNAFRHAAAQNVEVEIRYDEKYFRLRVRDDGKGIPADVLSGDGRKGHYGLSGMRERAKLIGGKLTIWTELDSGTEIELTIPGTRAYAKSTRTFWHFGKRSATDTAEKEPIERE